MMTPFGKLLIANRGEIALRVMRSARERGLRCVAVYSTADARSRHVREADQAVCIGEALPSQSYLNIAAIIAAARASGADAVHPGYGFLAENADFARACIEAGLVFIGPPPAAIEAMGDKARAKRLMQEAGVPCVPGYQGDDQTPRRLLEEAERIGWPVMIKAAAGGGGRGMRLVASKSEFVDLLRSAQSEASNAFGDATVILEKAIAEPRHVEIQVFADRHGNVIHLGDRDCSVQRRHQKLIEEAPSPAVTPELRERMGATAVAAARAIGYEGAGTLEFLLDRAGRYYFMEMNTRLQVEHPVTEAITGLDLVALQLAVAAGETLPVTQEQVRWQGHAIEVRLCAEDADFLPRSGTLRLWEPAQQLRVEHALGAGSEVPPYYDSMIAKLVAHGATRDQARRKLVAGLLDTVVLGVRTNQALLWRCLEHQAFVRGDATTAFIGRHRAELVERNAVQEEQAGALAAALLQAAPGGRPGFPPGGRFAQTLPVALRYEMDERSHAATIVASGPHRYAVQVGAGDHEVELLGLERDRAHCIVDGVMDRVFYVRDGPKLSFAWRGVARDVVDTTLSASATAGTGAGIGDGKARASVTGRVVAVLVQEGDSVTAGQALVTLEAMKMEHVHTAAIAGTVKALYVSTGEQVSAGRVVAEVVAPVETVQ